MISQFDTTTRRRYMLVGALLVVVMIFGRNAPATPAVAPSDTVNVLNSQKTKMTVLELPSAVPGETYRLTYSLLSKTIPNAAELSGSTVVVEAISDFKVVPDQLAAYQVTSLKQGKRTYFETFVKPQTIGQSIVFVLNDESGRANILVEGAMATRVAVGPSGQTSGLAATIFGQHSDRDLATYGSNDSSFSYIINKQSHLSGQLFSLDQTEIVSSVELAIDFKGSGGGGSYSVELYPISKEGDSFRIGQFIFSQKLTVNDLLAYYSSSQVGRYTLPVAAKLTKGDYLVAVNGDLSVSDRRNNLSLIGSQAITSGLGGINNRNGKTQLLQGQFYLKITTQEPSTVDGHPLPYAAVIQDVGNGQFLYSYKELGNSQGYVDYLSDTPTAAEDVAAYQTDKQAISLKATTPGKPIVLGYYFPYKATNFSFRATAIGGWAANYMYYSQDNINWLPLKNIEAENVTDIPFRSVVNQFNGQNLFIKIDPTQSGARLWGQEFGLKNISLEAELTK